MRPPRTRNSRIDFRDPDALRRLTINLTAAVTTIYILRLATLVIRESDDSRFSAILQQLTLPLVWPLNQLPLLSLQAAGDAKLGDALIVPILFLAGLLVLGTIAGWQEASSTTFPHRRRRT